MAEIRTLAGLGAILAGFTVLPAQAVPVTLCGTSICYEYDNDVSVNQGISLYGAPTLLSGNTIKFVPSNFKAESSSGFSTTVAVFKFSRVYTTDGGEVASITVTESGDYQIFGTGSVNVNMRLQGVDNVDDGAPTWGLPETTAPQFNWNTSTPTGFALANWSLTGVIKPAALFSDLATDVDFSIQNTLQAYTTSGNYASVQKKLSLQVTAVSTVPVPAAAWLFGSALGLSSLMRRRPG
jgi:hypothetical protein